MTAWEYSTLYFETNISDALTERNKAGLKGWEIYQEEFIKKSSSNEKINFSVTYFMKRPKTHELFSLLRHMIEYYYENGGINRELMVRLDDMIED